MPAVIPECNADADPDLMYEAFDSAGCLVVHGMADDDACARVRSELADYTPRSSRGTGTGGRLSHAL